jgi:hypothetical protein
MKSIFPAATDGDLLKLIHLSNSFRMIEGAKALQVGDIGRPEARIVSVTNFSEGKIVKVKGNCCRNNQPVIEVVSSFLYRGRFVDYENTFDTTEEPDYLVHLESDADVGVLPSNEWFEWDDMSPLLLAGTSLVFCIQSQVSFKDKTAYGNIPVSSDIFVRNQLKVLIKVDIGRPEARIVSVTNFSEGKIVKVKGNCCRNNQPVIEVVSSFLYRGRFVDYENTFDTTEEPDYLVHLESDADVGVLPSNEWFEWDDMSPLLLAGTSLVFCIQSQVSFKDKTAYGNIPVSSDIFVRNQLKVLIKVGSVDFQQDAQGNPVLAYLQRHGTPQGLTTRTLK